MSSESATQQPPSYNASIRTVYDETHRGVWHSELTVQSMGNHANLLGFLEHHEPTTDGTFAICFASGEGIFISKCFVLSTFIWQPYESIPEEHRSTLDTSDAGREVGGLMGSVGKILGSMYLPFLLMADTNEKVRLVLKVYVLPRLLMGMFWGMHGPFARNVKWELHYGRGGPNFKFDFKNGHKYDFKGI